MLKITVFRLVKEMILKLFIYLVYFEISCSADLYEDDVDTSRSKSVTLENLEFEPVVPITKNKEKTPLTKNLNCQEFSQYAVNCTLEAAMIYNSSRKSPPIPAKINDWCRAIRHLTNCGIDWNSECKDVTESHFNEESIKGHMHVVNEVCDDERFLSRYDELSQCIGTAGNSWEACYTAFKGIVDFQKNASQEWTHFNTHFYLCCARTRFRRCTLDTLFNSPSKCERNHAYSLQKFTIIVSEGDVFQDCEQNMMYTNCPDGDPRPNEKIVSKLMNADTLNSANVSFKNVCNQWYTYILVCIIKLC